MKLNLKCIKDILLAVQSATNFYDDGCYASLYDSIRAFQGSYVPLQDYSAKVISYNFWHLCSSGYMHGGGLLPDDGLYFKDLSSKGRDLLNQLNSPESFNAVKQFIDLQRKLSAYNNRSIRRKL